MSWDFQQGELDRKISENIAAILSKAHNVWLDDENYQRFCNLLISCLIISYSFKVDVK